MTNRELFHATMCGENDGALLHFEQAFTVPWRKWHEDGLPLHISQESPWCELSEFENLYDHFNVSGWLMCNIEEFCVPGFEIETVKAREGRNVVHDKNGNTFLQKSDDAYHNSDGSVNGSPPQELEFLIQTPHDYEQYRHLYTGSSDRRSNQSWILTNSANYQEQNDFITAVFIHGPFAFLRAMMGTENAIVLPYEEPELTRMILQDHLRTCIDSTGPLIQAVKPDCSFVWEDCCGGSPFISPAIFDDMYAWWYREWKEYINSMRVRWIVLDSDGNVAPLAKKWYEAGVDCLHPWEVNASKMLAFAEEYPKYCVMGGIYKHIFEPGSPSQIGKFKSTNVREEIDNELARVVVPMRKRGRYIPSLDHAANQSTQYNDYSYYCDTLRQKYGKANCVTRKFKT